MFGYASRQRADQEPPRGAVDGNLVLNVPKSLGAALTQVGQRWNCPAETAAHRIIVLALTGWKPKHAEVIQRLSHFVDDPDHGDPFRRTCLMLRHHFDQAEIELGEPVRECDRTAWLGTLLDTLRDRMQAGERAELADLLADGSIHSDGGA